MAEEGIRIARAFISVEVDKEALKANVRRAVNDVTRQMGTAGGRAGGGQLAITPVFNSQAWTIESRKTLKATSALAREMRNILAVPFGAGVALGKSAIGEALKRDTSEAKVMNYQLAKVKDAWAGIGQKLLQSNIAGHKPYEWAEKLAKALNDIPQEKIERIANSLLKMGEAMVVLQGIRLAANMGAGVVRLGQAMGAFGEGAAGGVGRAAGSYAGSLAPTGGGAAGSATAAGASKLFEILKSAGGTAAGSAAGSAVGSALATRGSSAALRNAANAIWMSDAARAGRMLPAAVDPATRLLTSGGTSALATTTGSAAAGVAAASMRASPAGYQNLFSRTTISSAQSPFPPMPGGTWAPGSNMGRGSTAFAPLGEVGGGGFQYSSFLKSAASKTAMVTAVLAGMDLIMDQVWNEVANSVEGKKAGMKERKGITNRIAEGVVNGIQSAISKRDYFGMGEVGIESPLIAAIEDAQRKKDDFRKFSDENRRKALEPYASSMRPDIEAMNFGGGFFSQQSELGRAMNPNAGMTYTPGAKIGYKDFNLIRERGSFSRNPSYGEQAEGALAQARSAYASNVTNNPNMDWNDSKMRAGAEVLAANIMKAADMVERAANESRARYEHAMQEEFAVRDDIIATLQRKAQKENEVVERYVEKLYQNQDRERNYGRMDVAHAERTGRRKEDFKLRMGDMAEDWKLQKSKPFKFAGTEWGDAFQSNRFESQQHKLTISRANRDQGIAGGREQKDYEKQKMEQLKEEAIHDERAKNLLDRQFELNKKMEAIANRLLTALPR